MEEKNKPETPRCEFKGAVPHPARPAYQLVWDLPSGPVVKWSCAEHRYSFGGNRGYWVNRTEGYEDNRNPRRHELAAPLDISVPLTLYIPPGTYLWLTILKSLSIAILLADFWGSLA